MTNAGTRGIMGRLDVQWDGHDVTIGQCNKMKTDPEYCNDCRHRFYCFTVRVMPDDTKISSADVPRLSDMMKELQVFEDE